MSDTPSATAEIKLPKDLAAEKGMVNVQIDGVWHKFPKGHAHDRGLPAGEGRRAALLLPPEAVLPGNCRMCLVEMGMPPAPRPARSRSATRMATRSIGWMPRPVIACANTVGGRHGHPHRRRAGREMPQGRDGVPAHQSPAGLPDLRPGRRVPPAGVQSSSTARGESRFRETKVKKPKNVDIGPRIRLDDERCIMCSRCIRFTAEIADDPVLGFTERGSHTTLTVHPGKRL